MMSRICYAPASLVLIGSLLSACAPELQDDFVDPAHEDASEPEPAAALDIESPDSEAMPAMLTHPECKGPERPVIAIASDGDCSLPLTTSWEVVNLFESGSDDVLALTTPVPASMNRYCRYSYTGIESRFGLGYDELGTLIANDPEIDVNTVGFDCRGFGGASNPDPLVAGVVESLHDAFMANVGAVYEKDLEDLDLDPVQLRLIDSTKEGITSYDLHGLRLEGIIDDLACAGDTTCMGTIKQQLALPRLALVGPEQADSPFWYYGGSVGYWSDFALAVYAAVQDWRSYNAAKPYPDVDHERLVLNVSLGAAPDTAELGTGPMLVAIDALKMAACYGVTVIAAAGNRSDNTCESESGMLAPAVFETMTRPTQAECEQVLGFVPGWDTSNFPVHALDPQPLLWAVGGVDGKDELPANGRTDSHPRLVATASGGVHSGGQFHEPDIDDVPMTGTSVSAAAASATAKLVWGYDPTLLPHEVMQTIYDGGYNLGEDAVGYYAGDDVHRLSVFGALQQAGATLPGVVGPPDANGNLDAYATAMEAREVDEALNSTISYHTNIIPIDDAPVCETPLIYPGLEGQPTKPVCAICGVETNDPGANQAEPHSLQMSMTLTGQGLFNQVTAGKLYLYDSTNSVSVVVLDQATRDAINNNPPFTIVKLFFDHSNTTKAVLKIWYADGSQEKNVLPVTDGTI